MHIPLGYLHFLSDCPALPVQSCDLTRLWCQMQIPKVTGKWVDHPNANHLGYYDPRTDCPDFAEDFNCLRPYPPAQADEELAAKEYRKVPFLAQLLV